MTTDSHSLQTDFPEYSSCTMCPRACGADRTSGRLGVCGAGAVPEVSHWMLHEWEEPYISCGAGSGAVFFSHCPLGCIYCQNHEISGVGAAAGTSQGKCMDADVLCTLFLELEGMGAANINLVTPTHFAPHIRAAVAAAKRAGMRLPVIWNTSGYETREQIAANAAAVDVYLADMKYASSGTARAFSNAESYPSTAMEAIGCMVDATGMPEYDEFEGSRRIKRGVVVRHLALPGHLEESKAAVRMLWESFGEGIRISIMGQYTPELASRAASGDVRAAHALEKHPELALRVAADEYEELLSYADSLGVPDYDWQLPGSAEQSFIPDFQLVSDKSLPAI